MRLDRRKVLGASLAAASSGLKPAYADSSKSDRPSPIQPGLSLVYEMTAELGEAIPIGESPDGIRRIIPVLSGHLSGPLISASLLPGGADWQVSRKDGVTVASFTYAMRTDDGHVMQISNKGLRHGLVDVMKALGRGEDVDPSSYYFKTVPEFIAPAGRYDWLNRNIFVGTGARYSRSIKLWVWRVD